MHKSIHTIILRHRKENLKKCSLFGLEGREDLDFYTYPWKVPQPDLSDYVVLAMDGEPLSEKDAGRGLFLIDGTWNYAYKMFKSLDGPFETRSIPPGFVTAYPRKQEDCTDPSKGLASIEALFIAYTLLGRETEGLLDHYYWKDEFLRRNPSITSIPLGADEVFSYKILEESHMKTYGRREKRSR